MKSFDLETYAKNDLRNKIDALEMSRHGWNPTFYSPDLARETGMRLHF